MKLNEEAPEQHLAIIVLAGIFLVINLLYAYKDSQRKAANGTDGPVGNMTAVVDENGEVINQQTLHQNPTLSWSDLFFCRGLKRSSWCSYRERHPDAVEAEEVGVKIVTAPPKQDHVVNYRGPMQRESIFSGRVSIPEESAPNRYFDLETDAEK